MWGWHRALGEDVFWKCPALQGTQLLLAFPISPGKRKGRPPGRVGKGSLLLSSELPLRPLDGSSLPTHPFCSLHLSRSPPGSPVLRGTPIPPPPPPPLSQFHFSADPFYELFTGREKRLFNAEENYLEAHRAHRTVPCPHLRSLAPRLLPTFSP